MRPEPSSASCIGKVRQAGEAAAAVGAFVAAGGQPAGSCSEARAETEVKINNTTNKSKSNHLQSAQLCPKLGLVTSGCSPRAAQRAWAPHRAVSMRACPACQPPAWTGVCSRLRPSLLLAPARRGGTGRVRGACRAPGCSTPRGAPSRELCRSIPPPAGFARVRGGGEKRFCRLPPCPGLRARTPPRTSALLRRPPGRQ